jgi:hypothetical protein
MAGMAGSAHAERGFKRGAWPDHGRIMPGSISRRRNTTEGKARGSKELSISPVQSKRLRAALAVAIPMDADDIDHARRSVLEVGGFKRAVAAYVLFRLGCPVPRMRLRLSAAAHRLRATAQASHSRIAEAIDAAIDEKDRCRLGRT